MSKRSETGEGLVNPFMISPNIGPWEPVYKNKNQQVYRVDADFGDFKKEYFVNDTGHRAGIVAVQDGLVLLVRQYRLLINRLSWELPGGRVDEGESPEDAAVGECLEETGVRCLDPRPLVFYHTGLDTGYNPTHLFYSSQIAKELEPQHAHPNEVSGSEWVPLSHCIEMIAEQEIVDSFSMLALLVYKTLVDRP